MKKKDSEDRSQYTSHEYEETIKHYGMTGSVAKQIQELQKRNAQLEEENLILKKKRVPYSCKTPSEIKSHLSPSI